MEIVKPEDLPRVELRGRVLYMAGKCEAGKNLAIPLVVVKRLRRDVAELVECLKHRPRPSGVLTSRSRERRRRSGVSPRLRT
ncbi:MAG: hypothetical protein ABWK05_00720 [Pyrobaculum sp.]